jgi:uncharacterized membrane protein
MNQKTFSLTSGIIFLVIALLHLARILYGWEAMIAGVAIPIWASWVALVVAAYLVYSGLRLRSIP